MLKRYLIDYPQLLLPIRAGISKAGDYTQLLWQVWNSGSQTDPFIGSEEDREFTLISDIGPFAVLYLAERSDFVRFVQAIAFKSEPAEIPASTGAMTIFSVTNYRKLDEYNKWSQVAEDKETPAARDASPWLDTVIVTTKGPYSRIPCEDTPFSQEEWLDKSLTIRMYHELAHVMSRKKYPGNKNALRDEVVADAVGLTAALQRYDLRLAKAFLGFDSNDAFVGGRISNYLRKDQSVQFVQGAVLSMISNISKICGEDGSGILGLDLLDCLEKWKIGISFFEEIV